jgi:hypothetical protein
MQLLNGPEYCQQSGLTVTCTISALEADQQQELTMTFSTDTLPSDGGIIVTTISSDANDPDGENNSARIHIRPDVVPGAVPSSIEITIRNSDSVPPGGILKYIITYRNNGGATAHNVFIWIDKPAQTHYFGATSTPGWEPGGAALSSDTAASGDYRYEVGTLEPGESGQVVFAVRLDEAVAVGTEITTRATIIGESDATESTAEATAEATARVGLHSIHPVVYGKSSE